MKVPRAHPTRRHRCRYQLSLALLAGAGGLCRAMGAPAETGTETEAAASAAEGTREPEHAAAPPAEDDWRARIDAFLEDYLPSAAEEPDVGDAAFVYELPDFAVEAYVEDAAGVRQRLPSQWMLLNEEAKKRWIAEERLNFVETRLLNRWILPWGIRPADHVLAVEEARRLREQQAHNAKVLEVLEEVRPDLLRAVED